MFPRLAVKHNSVQSLKAEIHSLAKGLNSQSKNGYRDLVILCVIEAFTFILFLSTLNTIRKLGFPNGLENVTSLFEFAALTISVGLTLAGLLIGVILFLRTIREIHRSHLRQDLIRSVSHDAKTPLTLLQLYGELLREEKLSEEDKLSYCNIILSETNRLSHVLNQLQEFSRIEKDSFIFQFAERDLCALVSETVDSYCEHLKRRGFKLDITIPDSLPPVKCDCDAVIQAIRNILDNARKYSKDTKYIKISLYKEETDIVLLIEDSGIGISETEQKRIFQPFYRADKNPFRKGTGLGLYLVQEIMKSHRGRIVVSSLPGVGTCVQLRFPALYPDRSPASVSIPETLRQPSVSTNTIH